MRRPFWIPLVFATALLIEGCATTTAAPRIPVAPVAVRETQTRSFENVDATTAMKAVIDMLQDGQFTINRTDATLGLVVGTRSTMTAPSAAETAAKWTTIAFTYGLSALLPWTKQETSELEASANVTPSGTGVTVRISLQRRTLDKNGRLKKVESLSNGILYADLFELLGRSLFVAGV